MPVTKRLPHLGSPKNLIEYILDEKNDGEKIGCASLRIFKRNIKWVELEGRIILFKVFLH